LRLASAPDEECIQLQRLFRSALADDGFVLHAPEIRIAFPSFQRLAVEDGFKSRVIIRRQSFNTRTASAAARLSLRSACLLRAGGNYLKGKKRRYKQGGGKRNKLFHQILLP